MNYFLVLLHDLGVSKLLLFIKIIQISKIVFMLLKIIIINY